MIILGLTGPINHGKSTFADILVRLEPRARIAEMSGLISEIADEMNIQLRTVPGLPERDSALALKSLIDTVLPQALRAKTTQDFDRRALTIRPEHVRAYPEEYQKLDAYIAAVKADRSLLNHAVIPSNKEDYRALLQWIGGYITTSLGRSLWCDELIARARKSAVEDSGVQLFIFAGIRLPVDADSIHANGGFIGEIHMPSRQTVDTDDPTERQRGLIKKDFTVVNNGTLDDLEQVAAKVLRDLLQRDLQATYSCREV